LLAYRIARFPVTNLEYRAFVLDADHSELPSSWHFRRFPEERANHPAYTVSAASADAYARWLARRTGRGFRLPGEEILLSSRYGVRLHRGLAMQGRTQGRSGDPGFNCTG
jgi:hypothetical protein